MTLSLTQKTNAIKHVS